MHSRRNATVILILATMMGSAIALPSVGAEKRPHSDEFITSCFEHGVPYDQARALGMESLPYLRARLEDPNYKPHWSNIAATIGYMGAGEDFTRLRHLVVNRFSGEVDSETLQAIVASMYGLGYIAAESKEAMQFLIAATDPAFFRDLKWTSGGYRRGLKLSQFAINAISLTGRPEAEEILKRLEKEPFDLKQIPNAREGLARCLEIERMGRDAYYRSAQAGPTASTGKK